MCSLRLRKAKTVNLECMERDKEREREKKWIKCI